MLAPSMRRSMRSCGSRMLLMPRRSSWISLAAICCSAAQANARQQEDNYRFISAAGTRIVISAEAMVIDGYPHPAVDCSTAATRCVSYEGIGAVLASVNCPRELPRIIRSGKVMATAVAAGIHSNQLLYVTNLSTSFRYMLDSNSGVVALYYDPTRRISDEGVWISLPFAERERLVYRRTGRTALYACPVKSRR